MEYIFFIHAYIGLLGLFVGSFLLVLIDRLPRGESVVWSRSHCESCKRVLQWFDLIPLVSYLVTRGRCRYCQRKLSPLYHLAESFIGGVFFVLSMLFLQTPLVLSVSLVLASVFFVIVMIDYRHYLISDSMLIVGMIATIFLILGTQSSFLTHVLSGFGASLFMYFIWFFTKGKGMGFGDVKLAFFLGLLNGFPGVIVALYVAFLTGAVAGIILIMRKKKSLKSKLPFGPFLIVGSIVALGFTSDILKLFGLV